jgi:hypothetical protein
MIKTYSISLILFLNSCFFGNTPKSTEKKDTIPSYDGIWAESEEENATFIIKGDSIQNVEHGDRMYFHVVSDTMIIDYGDFYGKHIILKLTQDSLVLRNEDKSITRLYKR